MRQALEQLQQHLESLDGRVAAIEQDTTLGNRVERLRDDVDDLQHEFRRDAPLQIDGGLVQNAPLLRQVQDDLQRELAPLKKAVKRSANQADLLDVSNRIMALERQSAKCRPSDLRSNEIEALESSVTALVQAVIDIRDDMNELRENLTTALNAIAGSPES